MTQTSGLRISSCGIDEVRKIEWRDFEQVDELAHEQHIGSIDLRRIKALSKIPGAEWYGLHESGHLVAVLTVQVHMDTFYVGELFARNQEISRFILRADGTNIKKKLPSGY